MYQNLLESVITRAHCSPSADNSQPWHFDWDGEKLRIRFDTRRIGGRSFPAEAPATLISIGAVLESVCQTLTRFDLSHSVELFPEGHTRPDLFAYVRAHRWLGGEHSAAAETLPDRHTNRFAYRTTPLPVGLLRTLAGMKEGGARVRPADSRQQINEITSLVKEAAKIRFQTREVHEWLGKSLRFSQQSVAQADGMDVRTLDLPPGGRLFLKFISDWGRMKVLNRLGIYRILAHIDSSLILTAPAMLAFVAPSTTRGALDAGRLLARAWTDLNAQGIAAHPYYVVADQLARLRDGSVPAKLVVKGEEIRDRSVQLFGLGPHETLHMLLRIGYPTRAAPRSLRLPLDRVFTDLTRAHD